MGTPNTHGTLWGMWCLFSGINTPADCDGQWTRQRVNELVERVHDAVNARTEHVYYEVVFMYAQKPLSARAHD